MKLLAFCILSSLFAPGSALTYAVDSSSLVSVATYTKARSEGFTKAIIRIYEEACGIGGEVDPNFLQTYKNARTAGYTDIDAYWFPCNGLSNSCKSYAQQLAEISGVLKANSLKIGTLWLDIEQDAAICNNWNYGAAGNLAQAEALVAAVRSSGVKYGIYSSSGEWSTVFGSKSVVLDNTAPLWFAAWNNVESVTLSTPFGGWTTAVGHQYTDVSASGQFDLNVFA
ncbi:hypothetical protein NQ176_g5307 [Zarea fungicola]|uniref:Uncharacterized protein n=1 Tax=Zarea fungicola TaxID=93591 RepID=A0ACC1N930_9HYPO|nr:hypothetical protein NQ176_g5307 [Lecanicillium fungicola]